MGSFLACTWSELQQLYMDKMQLYAIYEWKYEATKYNNPSFFSFFLKNLSLIVVLGIFICNYKVFTTLLTNA